MDALPVAKPRRVAKAGAWLASRFPFLWRTRTPLWILIAIVPAAFIFADRETALEIRTDALPTYVAVLSQFTVWWGITVAVMFACVIDVVLRADPVDSPRNALGFFVSVGISLAAIAIGQHIATVTVIRSIAALETDASLASLLQIHQAQNFWRCVDVATAKPIIDGNRAAISRDLERYGIRSDFTFEYPSGRCEGEVAEPRDLRVGSVGAPDVVAPSGLLKQFEDRVVNVKAAREYVNGEHGLYSFAPMASASSVLFAALIGATIATAFPVTRRLRIRLLGDSLRFGIPRLGRIRWPWSLDVLFASRFPTIWASRMYHVGRWLLVGGFSLYLVGLLGMRTTPGTYVLALFWSIAIGALVLLLGTQERLRYLSTRLRTEVGMFVCQTLVLVGGICLIIAVLDDLSVMGAESFMLIAWAALAFAGTLQAVRCGSWRTAFGGLVAGPLLLGWSGLTLSRAVGGDYAIAIGFALSYAALAFAGLRIGARAETRPTVRRITIAAMLTIAPVPAYLAAIFAASFADQRDVSWAFSVFFILTGAACSIAMLVITDYDRHAVAQ